MTRVAPRASAVNEKMPPRNEIATPSGVTRPTAMPRASIPPPITNSTRAVMLRPLRRATVSRVGSTEPPSACRGVTVSTRRDPAHAAPQVVRATTTTGSARSGCSSVVTSSRAHFKDWEHDKMASITGYRDRSFSSPCTGTIAPVHHTPWWTELDDSMATFLGNQA